MGQFRVLEKEPKRIIKPRKSEVYIVGAMKSTDCHSFVLDQFSLCAVPLILDCAENS